MTDAADVPTRPTTGPHSTRGKAPLAGFCAVILAGGTAARMGGIDKASVELGGRSLLARAIDACLDADEIVVVGEQVHTERPVTFVREDPAYGGPVAGLLAGVDALLRQPSSRRRTMVEQRPRTPDEHPVMTTSQIGVLAVDMPYVTAATLRRLREAAHGRDGAFLHDAARDRRHLAGVLDATRLAEVRPGLEERHGMAMHRLLDRLTIVDVATVGREHRDVDTWADLRDLDL